MALEGVIKEFGLADIFQLLGQQKKTGVLTLTDRGEKVEVSFERGTVVWAESAKRDIYGRLGEVLIQSGKIAEHQLDDALKIQQQTLQKIGHILIDQKMISQADLKEALQIQLLDTVYQLFRWKEGTYKFSQGNVSYEADMVTPVTAEHILMEGVRMMDEWPMIDEMIPSKEIVYKIREDAEPLSSPLKKDEEQVIMLVDGAKNVDEIVIASGLTEFDTCKILLVLEHAGLIAKTGVEKAGAAFEPLPLAAKGMERKTGFGTEAAFLALCILLALAVMWKNMGAWPFSASHGPFAKIVTQNRLEKVRTAVNMFKMEKGAYPAQLTDLASAGLVDKCALEDASGRPFNYKADASGATVSAP